MTPASVKRDSGRATHLNSRDWVSARAAAGSPLLRQPLPAGLPGVVSLEFAGPTGAGGTLSLEAGRDRGPRNLLGVLLDAYWTSLADDPLSALLFTALLSLAGVLLFLLWHIGVYLTGQL